MKAEISEEGYLIVIAEDNTEAYALDSWYTKNIDGCSLRFRDEYPKCFYIDTRIPKITLFKRIKFRIQLFFCR